MSLYITQRNKEAIYLFNIAYLMMAIQVFIAALSGGVPMPEEAHGGAIHTIPAEAWGTVCIAICAGVMLSQAVHSFAFVAVWAFLGALVNGYLFMFAEAASFGFLVSKGALVFTVVYGGMCLAGLLDATRFILLRYGDRMNDKT